MKLYEIEAQIMSLIDEETGEIADLETLNELEIARDTKIENIACLIKNLEADAKALKEEKMILADRQAKKEAQVTRLKEFLSNYLNGAKFETARAKISYRKSESVEIDDLTELMKRADAETYLTYKEPTANKTAIKEALKKGVDLAGCHLVTNNNIQIK